MQQWPGQQVSPAQSQTPMGNPDPIVAPAPPSERRAEQDQALQMREAERRAAVEEERLRLAQLAEARQQEQQRRDNARRDAGLDASEGERKSSGFLQRAIDAETNFRSLGDVQPRGIIGQTVQDAMPSVSNMMSDADRQRAVQAERQFIAAVLRYDSGAAIPPEEFVSNGQIYFPRPGDTPEVLAQKANARRVAIESLRDAGGRLTANVEIPDFDALQQSARPREATARDRAPLGYETGFDKMGRDEVFDRAKYLQENFGIDQGKETRLVGLINANNGNRNLSMAGLAQIYEDAGVPPPSPEDMETLLADLQSGKFRATTGIDTEAAGREYRQGLDAALDQGGDENTQGSAALFGAVRGGTFALNDEITGVGSAIAAGIQGENPVTAYQVNRDLVRRQTERTREAHPWTSIGSEIGGAMVTGGRAFGTPNSAGQAARIGAAEGGLYGYGSGDGLAGSTGNALVGVGGGAAVGAALHPVVNKIGNVLSSRAARSQVPEANALAEASTRRRVPLRQVDVNPKLQGKRADLLQNPQTRDIIRDADAEDLAAIEGAVARDLGDTPDKLATAENVGRGAVRSRQAVRDQAGRLYERAHSQTNGVRIAPQNALAALDQNIQELTEAGANQNAAAIRFLQGVKEDMSREGGLTVRALRDQRTGLRSSLSASGLDRTDLERRMLQVLDAAGGDIASGLRNNPEALQTFKRADQLWRQQAEFRDNILTQLIGRNGTNSPQQTASAIQRFMRGDPARARQLLNALDDADKGELRAFVAHGLGRSSNGEFSLARFLTHTGDGTGSLIDDRAARAIFGDDGFRAIQDLRALAGAKVTAASQTNRSNTGGIVQRAGRNLRSVMLAGIGLSEVGVTGGVAAPLAGNFITRLGDERAARLLINPDFTRWLRNAPQTANPQAIDRYFGRLRSLARRTPGMVADVDALERAIIGVVNDNSARIAAEPGNANEERQGQN